MKAFVHADKVFSVILQGGYEPNEVVGGGWESVRRNSSWMPDDDPLRADVAGSLSSRAAPSFVS